MNDAKVLSISEVRNLLGITRELEQNLRLIRFDILGSTAGPAKEWLLSIIDNRITEMNIRCERYSHRLSLDDSPTTRPTSPIRELGVLYIDGKPI